MKKNVLIFPLRMIIFMCLMIYGCKKNNTQPTDIDGNVYRTVVIGSQVWMVENLEVTHYRNGDPIPNVADSASWVNLNTDAYCDYATPDNRNAYGKMYNWYAVHDSRNIAPQGWHIPTNDEWITLVNFLGGADSAGGKLKEAGTSHWDALNLGATNESGFTALPGGCRTTHTAGPIAIAVQALFWTSTEDTLSNLNALMWGVYGYYMSAIDDSFGKGYGLSVRCVKD